MISSQAHLFNILLLLQILMSIQFVEPSKTPTIEAKDAADDDDPLIYHGTKSPKGKWPFMVSLQKKGRHFCGGSILNDEYILTAGHCIRSEKVQPEDVTVIIGHTHLDSSIDSDNIYSVDSFERNSNFNYPRLKEGYDIGLVKLASKIKFDDDKVSQVCLPASGAIPIGEKCTTIGWGKTEEGKLSKDLLEAVVPIIKPEDCKALGNKYNEKLILCAGDLKAKTDSCQGDSGGPLLCPHKGNKKEYLQFGIVSYGKGCGKNGGLYTDVRTQIEWIRKHAES